MDIFILTRGRPERQITAGQLKKAGIDFTYVVSKNDDTRKELGGKQLVFDVKGISDKRQAVLDHAKGKMVMLDDDVYFKYRLEPTSGRATPCTNVQLRRLIALTEKSLDMCDLFGLARRFMIHTKPYPAITGGMQQAHYFGFDARKVRKMGVRFDRVNLCQDADFVLQMLTKGAHQVMRTDFIHDDATPFGAGGCATWRTLEKEIEEYEKMKKLWPGIFDYKISNGHTSATIRYKKAIKEFGQ